ncbi:hypothetical protein JW758_05545 [Candidatus Peregrinibacteria bacterium]|nr:hypothetical protein [Candidatus Peregrinibacteria bacterium]
MPPKQSTIPAPFFDRQPIKSFSSVREYYGLPKDAPDFELQKAIKAKVAEIIGDSDLYEGLEDENDFFKML